MACVIMPVYPNAVNSFLERSMVMKTTAVILIPVAIAASQPAEILRLVCATVARILGL